jgi:hypothetical protein
MIPYNFLHNTCQFPERIFRGKKKKGKRSVNNWSGYGANPGKFCQQKLTDEGALLPHSEKTA